MKDFRYIDGAAILKLNEKACVGCGMCVTVCPHRIFELEGKKARIVDYNACMECGACATNCPVDAIRVTPGVGCAVYIIQTWLKGRPGAGKVRCC
jgi:ferredoxin